MGKNTRSHAVVVFALVVAALVLASSAGAADIGANDDTGKFADDGGSSFFSRMSALGLQQTVMTVRFLPDEPGTIQGKVFLDKAVPEAVQQGLRVVFAVYPYPPRSLARTQAEATAFAQRLAAQPAYLAPLVDRGVVRIEARLVGPEYLVEMEVDAIVGGEIISHDAQ